jgi:hypothetical protein
VENNPKPEIGNLNLSRSCYRQRIGGNAKINAAVVPMNTLRTAFLPGLIAGVISIFTSWFWMGVIFHRYQRETPETWRPEGPRNYIGASLLHVLAAIGIACLFTLMVRFKVAFFAIGFHGSLCFALCIWGVLALPILLESALFIRLHRFVVLGQLLDWLTTSLLASSVTRWWLRG